MRDNGLKIHATMVSRSLNYKEEQEINVRDCQFLPIADIIQNRIDRSRNVCGVFSRLKDTRIIILIKQ